MKFESITMENFMRYKGKNRIEFSCDDVKNVTVVLGDNTVGKTTIAQAFRWGLYGALMANGTKSAGDFQLLNTDILEMMDANSRAKVKVEIAAVDEEKRYIITRETTYTRAFPKSESREFQKKCAMRITELEDMESYVEVDSNESISCKAHDNQYEFGSFGIQSLQELKKYQVDVLGNITEVRQEKRRGFH